jgi:prolyl-tRNA synthetase
MAPCPAGENDVALAPGYAANTEIASAEAQPVPPLAGGIDGDLHTPGATTVASVASALEVGAGNELKAFPVITESRGLVMAFVRGDHRVNEIKLTNALKEGFRPAREEELGGRGLVPGFLGPTPDVPSLYDEALVPGQSYVTGANRPDYHRVVSIDGGERGDLRTVEAGDTVNGHPIRIEPAIEVGNIFKLGTKFTDAAGATYLGEDGKEHPIVMGSYGIGVGRNVACIVEEHHDEKGIVWPEEVAPYAAHLVAIGANKDPQVAETADRLHDLARGAGYWREILYDDRDESPGVKFTDAELLGMPWILTVSPRSLAAGGVEVTNRATGERSTRAIEDVEALIRGS